MMNELEERSTQRDDHKVLSQNTPNSSLNDNRELKPAGFGGWLILPMLGIIISLFYLPYTFWRSYAATFEYWGLLTDPLSPSFMPMFKELIYFEVLGNIIVYGTLLFLCYLFFTKKKLTIKVIIFFYVFSLVLVIADVILVKELLSVPVDDDDTRNIIRAMSACAIWIPYFLKSVRVKNTFVN
nr:DUF2569 domain-containing protein [Providencia stuartii]